MKFAFSVLKKYVKRHLAFLECKDVQNGKIWHRLALKCEFSQVPCKLFDLRALFEETG